MFGVLEFMGAQEYVLFLYLFQFRFSKYQNSQI